MEILEKMHWNSIVIAFKASQNYFCEPLEVN